MANIRKLVRRKARRTPRQRRKDAKLRALGRQFDVAIRELASLEMNETIPIARIEAFLAAMEPLEHAILATPADGLEDIAVKARLAAHLASNYWEVPSDRLDLEARAFRLLVEAICDVAGVSLPFPLENQPRTSAVQCGLSRTDASRKRFR
jgi:hypothetical protein